MAKEKEAYQVEAEKQADAMIACAKSILGTMNPKDIVVSVDNARIADTIVDEVLCAMDEQSGGDQGALDAVGSEGIPPEILKKMAEACKGAVAAVTRLSKKWMAGRLKDKSFRADTIAYCESNLRPVVDNTEIMEEVKALRAEVAELRGDACPVESAKLYPPLDKGKKKKKGKKNKK